MLICTTFYFTPFPNITHFLEGKLGTVGLFSLIVDMPTEVPDCLISLNSNDFFLAGLVNFILGKPMILS